MGITTITAYQCDRCKHKWIPRLKIEEKPTICPKCKSPYWDKPRRIDLAKGETDQAHYSMQRKRGKMK